MLCKDVRSRNMRSKEEARPSRLRRGIILPLLFLLLSATVVILIGTYTIRLDNFWTFGTEEEAICERPPGVFFLKLHKCAGSSVQNVLLRMGEKLQLQVALPPRGNYFGHPERFHSKMIHRSAEAKNQTHQLLAHHLRLDPDQVTQVVGTDALWLTVMRRPVDQFLSMFHYYNLQDVWNVTLEEFAATPVDTMPPEGPGRHFVPNQMAFDLGFDVPELLADEQLQDNMVETVRKRFHFVLMADLMDESLVLLRHKLCLDWDDVVVFRHNVRPPQYRSKAEANLTLRRQLRHHLAADVTLFHHFHRRLRQQIREHGIFHIERGVEELRRRHHYWSSKCKYWRFVWPGGDVTLPPPAKSGSAKVAWMCSRLFAHELLYTDHIRRQQESKRAQPNQVTLKPKSEPETLADVDSAEDL